MRHRIRRTLTAVSVWPQPPAPPFAPVRVHATRADATRADAAAPTPTT